MANVAAPRGFLPVQTEDGNPYTGKANLYHIQSTDTLSYYVGDVVQAVTATANGSTVGSDANGVPNITGFPRGVSVTAYGASGSAGVGAFIGVIVGIQVAPIGVGAGATQNNAVNLNNQFVPATKAQDYYVWVADDPALIFECQGSASLAATTANAVNSNATFLPTVPANTIGPLSASVVDTFITTNTAPFKVYGIPYRPNIVFGVNMPLLVRFNTHFFNSATGTTGQ
jgi:hypothetical protein